MLEGGTELGRRLHWETMRRGVGRAKEILVVGDGAAWIWNVTADRWKDATELLDFFHASQHVWALGEVLYGEGQAQEWVEARLHLQWSAGPLQTTGSTLDQTWPSKTSPA